MRWFIDSVDTLLFWGKKRFEIWYFSQKFCRQPIKFLAIIKPRRKEYLQNILSELQSNFFCCCTNAKGQLISKCHFGVIVSTNLPMKKFENSALPILRQNLSNFFVGKLVETMTPKGHFEINWPLLDDIQNYANKEWKIILV